MADVIEVSPITQVANANGQHPRPPRRRLRSVSNAALRPLTAVAVPPAVVPETPPEPLTFTPNSVVDITWPGQMTYDADGTPNGMSAPRIYRMTAGPSGAHARWLTLREQSA